MRSNIAVRALPPQPVGGEKRRAYYPAVVRLAVGDMVVYGSHGAGHVAARERRVVLGKRQEVIVLALAAGSRWSCRWGAPTSCCGRWQARRTCPG
jgi:hypothetical protein